MKEKFWQPDKKKHYWVADVAVFLLNIILFAFFFWVKVEEPLVCNVIIFPAGLAAIILWEKFVSEKFSVGDLCAGFLGILSGMIESNLLIILVFWIFK